MEDSFSFSNPAKSSGIPTISRNRPSDQRRVLKKQISTANESRDRGTARRGPIGALRPRGCRRRRDVWPISVLNVAMNSNYEGLGSREIRYRVRVRATFAGRRARGYESLINSSRTRYFYSDDPRASGKKHFQRKKKSFAVFAYGEQNRESHPTPLISNYNYGVFRETGKFKKTPRKGTLIRVPFKRKKFNATENSEIKTIVFFFYFM